MYDCTKEGRHLQCVSVDKFEYDNGLHKMSRSYVSTSRVGSGRALQIGLWLRLHSYGQTVSSEVGFYLLGLLEKFERVFMFIFCLFPLLSFAVYLFIFNGKYFDSLLVKGNGNSSTVLCFDSFMLLPVGIYA